MAAVSLPSRVLGRKIKSLAHFCQECIFGASGLLHPLPPGYFYERTGTGGNSGRALAHWFQCASVIVHTGGLAEVARPQVGLCENFFLIFVVGG